jgi:hypothetical protein
MNHEKSKEKISKALGEFRFRRFDKLFFWGGGGQATIISFRYLI